MFAAVKFLEYEIKPLTIEHLTEYARLSPAYGHKDPNDHIIIAQAISDKIPLISSDTKFKHYTSQGLNFIFNKR
ncbi:type II toxin-antitoxin system VapC family toxin [Viscerimonas tarda]